MGSQQHELIQIVVVFIEITTENSVSVPRHSSYRGSFCIFMLCKSLALMKIKCLFLKNVSVNLR